MYSSLFWYLFEVVDEADSMIFKKASRRIIKTSQKVVSPFDNLRA